jgi:hypothetical protein
MVHVFTADKTAGITIIVNKSTVYVGAQWKSKDERENCKLQRSL